MNFGIDIQIAWVELSDLCVSRIEFFLFIMKQVFVIGHVEN
jgi:hypothetical protein